MAYRIDEYEFDTKAEYQEALKEAKAISYITSQMKTEEPEVLYGLYCQMLEKDLFHTKLGLGFLEAVYQRLIPFEKELKKKIPPVPYKKQREKQSRKSEQKNQISYKKLAQKYKKRSEILLIICITLVLIVLGMFYVNSTSQNPTILNYEEKIVDKYAAWEQDLVQREEKLKERDK